MRVIGGTLRGKKLISPSDAKIRPTSDRLRETIFNIIGQWVMDAAVLDLFAGTGAFGIEALSRGARHALFVDCSKAAVTLITRNLKRCRLEDRAEVVLWDAARNLNVLRSLPHCLHLVFMDPPYGCGLVAAALRNLGRLPVLAPGSRLVIEHAIGEELPANVPEFTLRDQRRYGKTLVSILERVV